MKGASEKRHCCFHWMTELTRGGRGVNLSSRLKGSRIDGVSIFKTIIVVDLVH